MRIAVGPASVKWPAFAASFLDAASNPPAAKGGSSHALRWLMHLGAVGIFALAVVDSSVIPIPLPGSTDLVLLLMTAFRSQSIGSPILFGSCAFVGSVIGGYTTWAAGKKGGEAALDRLGQGALCASRTGLGKAERIALGCAGLSAASAGAADAVSACGRSAGTFARTLFDFVLHGARGALWPGGLGGLQVWAAW